MGLHPDLEEFKYDLKENTGRRMLSGLIDHFVVLALILVIGGFITVALNGMHAPAAIIGPFADIITPAVGIIEPPSSFIMMIYMAVVQIIITGLYFSFFEANGRRPLGKKIFHLEVLTEDGSYLTFFQALKRNLFRTLFGALAIYFTGLVGWAVLMGISGLLDIKLGKSLKRDLRQRLSEVFAGTMVFLEDDDLPMGTIKQPGSTIKKKEKKGSSPSKKMKTSVVMARKKGKKKLPEESEKGLLGPAEEKSEEEPELERSKDLSMDKPEKIEKEEPTLEEPEEDEAAEKKEEKVPFWKKLFGGGKKDEDIQIEQVPGPDDIIVEKEPEQLPARKEIGRDETVLQFMFDFDISEERAQAIYDMGYRNKAEFKDAIPKDLIMIKGINPTIAKRIVERANE